MLRISDTCLTMSCRVKMLLKGGPPHLLISPGTETFSPAAPQFASNWLTAFGDASTAFRLDALQFNTSRIMMRISIKLSGVF